jgi:hypothetical protein
MATARRCAIVNAGAISATSGAAQAICRETIRGDAS